MLTELIKIGISDLRRSRKSSCCEKFLLANVHTKSFGGYMKNLIKLEYVALMLLTLYFYIFLFEFSIWLLIILLLTPDISMIGYFFGNGIGAVTYNIFHNLILASMMLFLGFYFKSDLLISLSLILLVHIFMDRSFGYGLKHKDDFKHTHIDQI